MYKIPRIRRLGVATGWTCASVLLVCGCEKTESITTYTAPKHDSLQSTEFLADYKKKHPSPERMIGLVLPKGDTLWFFKMQGNLEAIAAEENTVREFLEAVTFSSSDQPEWKLPAGWRQLPGDENRFATLVLNREPSLEMSVSKLDARSDVSLTDQVIMNVNRWRGQLSLPSIDDESLVLQTEKFPVGNDIGYLSSLIGRPQPKPAGMALPFPPSGKSESKPDRGDAQTTPAFEKPAEWTSVQPPPKFASIALQARDDDRKAVITVTRAGGNTLLNVNRWRAQVGLNEWTEEELASNVKQVSVGPLTGDLYEMANGERAIFGVIVDSQNQMWFVKLDGDARLADRERARFEGFLKSLRLDN